MHWETRKEARLDRALCDAEWRVRFQEGVVRHLIRAGSDHSPLLIATEGFTQSLPSKKPFRFHSAWLYHHQFENLVKDNWDSNNLLAQNLSALASKLVVWNREVFGDLFHKKRRLWARIEGIQRKLETGAPWFLLKLDRRFRQELAQTLDQIAIMWLQKARIDHLCDGDRNTKYFHMSTIIRRRFNRIDALRDREDRWCTDAAMVKKPCCHPFQGALLC